MRRFLVVPVAGLVGVLFSGSVPQLAGQAAPGRGPLEPYLMEEGQEIELARSAAPASVSRDATVLVLTPSGLRTAVEGTNGFVCLVDRSWGAFFSLPASAFWNSRQRGPTCLNPQAVRTVLPVLRLRTELAVAGRSQEEMMHEVAAAFRRAQLRPPEVGAMAYMMSRGQYLDDRDPVFRPHVMFYTPSTVSGKDWGANLQGSPVMVGIQRLPNGDPEPQVLFLVPVDRWSDGSAAPAGSREH